MVAVALSQAPPEVDSSKRRTLSMGPGKKGRDEMSITLMGEHLIKAKIQFLG